MAHTLISILLMVFLASGYAAVSLALKKAKLP